jgi:hypothetical protein
LAFKRREGERWKWMSINPKYLNLYLLNLVISIFVFVSTFSVDTKWMYLKSFFSIFLYLISDSCSTKI